MRVILLSSLPIYLLAAASVQADTTATVSAKFAASWYTHLTELNQSQTFEALSMADRFSGLPASSFQTAAVNFIVGKSGQKFGNAGMDNEFDDPSAAYCKRFGFAVTSCSSGLFNRTCPYNDKIYDKCCDTTYHYTASQCTAPRQLSSDSCGGKYSCLCNTSSYSFTSCNDPQIKGAACTDEKGTRYASCVCPNSVATPYGCETYYAAPCGSVCKKAYADNCRNRTAAATPYGCQQAWGDCASKCQIAYADNCRNRTAVAAPYGCKTAWSDCPSKCQVALTACEVRTAVSAPYGCKQAWSDCPSKCQVALTACEVRTAVSAPYGCKTAWSDCPSKCQVAYTACEVRTAASCSYGCQSVWSDCTSKCQTCYPDNCRNRTAVATPHGCAVAWSDCASKCQLAYGPACKIGDIYYSDGTCINPAYHSTSKKALGVVVYITDNGNHGQIMTASHIGRGAWSPKSINVPGLPDYDKSTDAVKDFGSCQNTQIITAYGDSSKFPAAWETKEYAPTPETRGKWCLPAAGIWNNVLQNKNAVQTGMVKLGGGLQESPKSSTEYDNRYQWAGNMCIELWFPCTSSTLGVGFSSKQSTDASGTPRPVYAVLEF